MAEYFPDVKSVDDFDGGPSFFLFGLVLFLSLCLRMKTSYNLKSGRLGFRTGFGHTQPRACEG